VNLRREFALNPLPVTPMLVPSFPLTELRVIEGAFQKIEVNGMFSPKSWEEPTVHPVDIDVQTRDPCTRKKIGVVGSMFNHFEPATFGGVPCCSSTKYNVVGVPGASLMPVIPLSVIWQRAKGRTTLLWIHPRAQTDEIPE